MSTTSSVVIRESGPIRSELVESSRQSLAVVIPTERKKKNKAAAAARSTSGLFFIPTFTVRDAFRALSNNETRMTSEVKGAAGKVVSVTKMTYPAELVTALRGLFSSSKGYTFEMHQVLDVSSSAGGGTLGFVALSPSVASYGEWTALAALFDEVKGLSTSISWNNALQPTVAAVTPATICMAVDEQDLSTDPSSTLAVYRLAGSQVFVSQFAAGGSGTHHMHRQLASRYWCDTATPFSQSPIGGLIGCWVYGNDGLFPASTVVAHVFSKTVARFRCRA